MESIAEENLHEILLKLPARDVARCRCVCKPWRSLLTDPSFCRIHALAGSGGAEALLISQARPRGKTMETNVLSVSSPKRMCLVVDLAEGYRVASVCNGFIVLASGEKEEPSYSASWDPLFVCNPVNGEKIRVPAPPGLKTAGRHLFAMGFSASSHQYKLFRLPFQESTTDDNYLDIYTFGGCGWRRQLDLLRRHGVRWAGLPPVLVDGKIYVLTKPRQYGCIPNNMLVIDVVSEAYRTYRLMPDYDDTDAVMDVFELGGQPCVAVHVPIPGDRSELHIWVMPTPQLVQGGQQQLDKKLPGDWIRRYSFYCDSSPVGYPHLHEDHPMGTWVEGDRILCCIIGDHMYRYETTDDDNKQKDEEDVDGCFSSWNHKLQMPSPPNGYYERRGIYGGYRPTLLSPSDLAVPQDNNADEQFQHAWLGALQFHKSSNQAWLDALRFHKSSNQCQEAQDNGSDQQSGDSTMADAPEPKPYPIDFVVVY